MNKKIPTGLRRTAAWTKNYGINIPVTAKAAMLMKPFKKTKYAGKTACGCGDCSECPEGRQSAECD